MLSLTTSTEAATSGVPRRGPPSIQELGEISSRIVRCSRLAYPFQADQPPRRGSGIPRITRLAQEADLELHSRRRMTVFSSRGVRQVLVATAVTLQPGCGDGPTEPRFVQPDVRNWVTGIAAQAVDGNGHFTFPVPQIATPYSVITPTRARDLSAAYVATFGPNPSFVSVLQVQRGGATTNLDVTEPSGRVEFAESPYEPVTPETSGASRRSYGPFFIVRMLEKGAPVLSLRVSAYATDVTIGNGTLVFPAESGGEFDWFGIPPAIVDQNPISPEVATETVAKATGAKVDTLPVLVAPHRDYAFQFARWKLRLDRPVTLRVVSSGRQVVGREVYVGLSLGPREPAVFYVPAEIQATRDTVPKAPPVILSIRPQYPVAFERVAVVH